MITDITTLKEYTDAVEENDHVVMLFSDPSWCGPCRMFDPHIEKVSEHYGDKVKFLRTTPTSAEPDLADRFTVMSIPAVFHSNNGEESPIQGRTALAVINEINVS